MIPDLKWVEEIFNKYNQSYFRGVLKKPRIVVTRNCNFGGQMCLGYYKYFLNKGFMGKINVVSPGVLYISNAYNRPEKDWTETVLHEMIHMYIYTILKIVPSNPHDKNFMKVANWMRGQGWNIQVEKELEENTIEITEGIIQEIIEECIIKIKEKNRR